MIQYDFKYRRTATKIVFFFLIGEVLFRNVTGILVVGIKHLTDTKIWKGRFLQYEMRFFLPLYIL